MRAITGAVTSSRPCPLPKAARVLVQFSASAAASDLPSSDCATYLRVANEAFADHLHFRRELRRGLAARGCEGSAEGEEEPRHRLGRDDGDVAPVLAHGSAVKAELAAGGGGGEKKSRKKKKIKEEEEDHRDNVAAVAGVASPEIAGEKRKKRKKKEKHSSRDHEASVVKQEPDVVASPLL